MNLERDTTLQGLFLTGWDRAIAQWRAGETVESVTHAATGGSPVDRGMVAACEMILGWLDIAEREMRAHGWTRHEATRFVTDASRVEAAR